MFWRKRKREIFAYSDGSRKRFADPIVVMRAMASHETLELDTHLAQLQSGEESLQNEASEIIVAATREIFGVRGFSEKHPNGLTEMETIDLLNQFIAYIDGLKKNGSGQPT